MITINKQPYLCCFTKNSIDFEISTDLQYDSAVVYPQLVLEFLAKPTLGTTFRISFTNPETGKTTEIDLVAVDGSSASNYSNKWQIPDSSFSGSLSDLRNMVYGKLREHAVFNALYTIELPIVEFPGSTPRITITAKQAISELVMAWDSTQPIAEEDKFIGEANSVAYHQPGVRDGYELKASLYVESDYNSGKFNLITSLDCILDENSLAHVDVSKYIDAEIEGNWSEYPLPYEQQLGYKAPNLRRYYVEFSETFSDESETFITVSEILYAHWGGASFDDSYNLNPIAAQNTSGQWLTWWPSGKRILREQNDWLAWMNGAEKITFNVVCLITTNEDVYQVIKHEGITLQPFETFIFNTGFEANLLKNDVVAGEIISSWEWELKQQDTNVIHVTFTLDGVAYAYDVPKTEVYNGKNRYALLSGLYTVTFEWNIDISYWIFTLDYNTSEWRIIYTNPTDSEFPIFDTWTFNSGTELTDLVTTAGMKDSFIDNFRYYPLENCLAKQILYFNSFGIPESFLLSGEFQQNITTSQELAVRTESFSLSNKLPQNYIFDSRNVISYTAETLMLSNKEAERLMPLINSTITYLVESERFIPVILNAGTTAVLKVNDFLQKIKLEIARANESDRVSYYEVLSDFEPLLHTGIGISICTLQRNLLNITDFGNIQISKNGVVLGIFTYNSVSKYYTGTAITEEGLLTFELTCQVNGVEKVVRKQVNYSWDEITYEIVYSGSEAYIYLESLYASTPMRIDWNDGTTEDVTLSNVSGDSFTHTYAANGKKTIRLMKPSFFDITRMNVIRAMNMIDISKFTYLNRVRFEYCAAGNYYFTGLKQLAQIVFQNTVVHQLNIGFQKDLEFIYLDGTNISEENFEALILELWLFRKAYANHFEVQISSEVVISATAQACIDATGIYAGDGLITYGITVTNI